jgi:hypothetical protein
MQYTISLSPSSEAILLQASYPSISGDNLHLYANRISTTSRRSLHYTNISTLRTEIISDASFAAAEASGTSLLVESDWGIERITFE